ncbi:receptor-interacting serine/threonine-protein kinase 2-like isoform X2 [Chiloscyllium plagiosum]|uniref:receptor-interacting serine/threonine-protein kinase 2-like isoform X2 n=1 Tax=Chiloscyllium plagiosum TaxID=36176 RepID=UPI001CB884E0|nr:receptor-interacting serine/threonine-protein kinase 2-like isoform X2 [Chiloscyllium plagiosum]
MESTFGKQHSPGRAEGRLKESPAGHFTSIAPRDLGQRCCIAYGGFGKVYKVWHRSWGIWVAVKLLRLNGSDKKELLEEAKKMYRAQFEHILQLYGVVENMMDRHPSLGLVTEFMEVGSLDKLLKNYDVPWPLRMRFAYEIALGVNYLHNLEPALFHHDLKPANIVLNNDYRVKICDFGLAKWRQSTGQYSYQSSKCAGTLSYIPPECFENINASHGAKFDVYSYGIVIWVIITRQEPYENAVNSQQMQLCVKKGDRPDCEAIPKDLPEPAEELVSLMKRCWHSNPDERPPFLKCIQDLKLHQPNEQDVRNAIQVLAEKKSQSACRGSDSPTAGYESVEEQDGDINFVEPVEEQDGPINFVKPIQEQNGPVKVDGRVKEQHGPIRAVEPRQDTSQEETVKRPFSIPNSDECIILAISVNKDWKMIGRKLGLTDNDICIIDADCDMEGLKEKAYQMFQKWIQKQGKHATRQALFKNLKMMERSDVAMHLLDDTVTGS